MDALALLRLQIDWGADEALSEDPVDRLRPLAPASAPAPAAAGPRLATGAPVPAAPRSAPTSEARSPSARPVPSGSAVERATGAAAAAQSLGALREALAAFDGCALRDTATNLVFCEGDPAGRLLMIGEPPGAEEDRTGRPFAGPEGALLDRMLGSIGLERPSLLLMHLIPWRPPGGRPPHAGELATCMPFLFRLIELAAPQHVVLFGTLTARTLLPGRRAGKPWGELTGPRGAIPTLALPGPAMLLKTPARRKEAWAGLRQLRRALDGEVVKKQ